MRSRHRGFPRFPRYSKTSASSLTPTSPRRRWQDAVRDGAGELLEDVRLFDVYTGPQVGENRKSLTFALRFRAADRTLTEDEASAARDAAVRRAAEQVGAVLRG